ncbi:MAG: DUF262 domain-containing protein [Hyphomicrobium sp.]|nr:DUF262 domain-containing protein [Hyphomicrobium sp.]
MLTLASLPLSEILSGPFLLNVPVYQRPYSWGRPQVEQLLDDLMEASGLGTASTAEDSYFLGTILLMDAPGTVTKRLTPKMTPREFDVVDGQQRLVTMMTMFCVLRDLEQNAKKPIGKRVQGMAVAQLGSRFFRTERFRMHLANRERNVFEQFILLDGSTANKPDLPFLSESENALLAMRQYLVSELSTLKDDQRSALFDFITERCIAAVLVSHNIDRAHRMFVVLNERGKRLQRDDILKADILSRVPQADVKWIAEKWDQTGAALGKDFEVFFSHVRKIYGYDNRQVVSGVRSVIDDAGGAEPFINKVFVPLSQTYQIIRSAEGQGVTPEIARRLQYLNRLADGDWAPAAMLALAEREKDPERTALLISEIDRMAHVMRLLCAGTGKRVRRFADIIDVIRSGAAVDATHPVFQLAREETRSIAFHLKDLHKRGPKICKLLLLRLGDQISGSFAACDPESYTIEHILPQRPSATSEWRVWYPTAEERSQSVESLGNLVLISQDQNDKARNASFAAKQAIYTQTSDSAPLLPITAEVLQSAQWQRADIEARETRLLTMIADLLRIEVPLPKSVPPMGTDQLGPQLKARASRA